MDVYRNNEGKQRGKLAAPYMERGMVIGVKRQFRIEKMVGSGGFGQIFRAIDLENKLVVAVKVEPKSSDSGRLILELNILVKLAHCVHTPTIYYSGEIGSLNYIIMQILGRNVGDLRKSQRTRSLSTMTASRIGVQCLECLSNVHALGYIHRDMKPSNICVGIGEHRRVFYIVDFGMARQIRLNDGSFRPERRYASFRGTTRYVSLTAHERKEQGFVDDIWSLFFSIVELVEGLPWKHLADQDEVASSKRLMLRNFHSKRMGRPFDTFPVILEKTRRTDLPDYERLREILKTSCDHYNDSAEFEWDQEDSLESTL